MNTNSTGISETLPSTANTNGLLQFTTSSDHNSLVLATSPTDAPGTGVSPAPSLYDGLYNVVLAGVIIAIILVLLVLVGVLLRYMYRHKGSYHTHEDKGAVRAETADAALREDPALQEAMDESKKEYFI